MKAVVVFLLSLVWDVLMTFLFLWGYGMYRGGRAWMNLPVIGFSDVFWGMVLVSVLVSMLTFSRELNKAVDS